MIFVVLLPRVILVCLSELLFQRSWFNGSWLSFVTLLLMICNYRIIDVRLRYLLSVVMAWIEKRLSVQIMICLLQFDVR